ncbi:response regulator transcription factor [Enterococcus sp. BWR-S5]|uniref:response regulator transcription factor n=1 Tax=Enterococcus sp. BWR-S5 TaxID=2787714 RepID=UPI0019248EBB|nr:response regulator transcription factor [Enterococcus sp. BWR-S5]MBL1224420.1 response regulator transcription factor [Enterococcus sp. BWR-S5]
MKHVLVVDDEPSILTLLKFNLEKDGYKVSTAEHGTEAYELALDQSFDFIILDVMLPGMDGLDITKALRREKVETPILILTAKDDQVDKIIGLEIGADDYLTKPFSPREVLARMKAIFRRTEGSKKTVETTEPVEKAPLTIGDIHVDENNYEVFVRGEKIELTPKEFELLVYFMKRKDRVINRDTLLERIWQYDFSGQSRIVDVHVSHLRDKIEKDPKRPAYLVTVRGFGYRFQEPKK